MIEIDIPGVGEVRFEHLVSDYSGTLLVNGRLIPGIREQLNRLSASLKIHILTADTHGKARSELEGIRCETVFLKGGGEDI